MARSRCRSRICLREIPGVRKRCLSRAAGTIVHSEAERNEWYRDVGVKATFTDAGKWPGREIVRIVLLRLRRKTQQQGSKYNDRLGVVTGRCNS